HVLADGLRIEVPDVLAFAHPGVDQPDAGDVQKAERADLRRLVDVPAETLQHGPTRASRVYDRGNAGAKAGRVRPHAPGGRAGVDVGVDVDEAGGDRGAGGVQERVRHPPFEGGFYRRDEAVPDADIAAAAQVLAGVDDVTTDDQIERSGLHLGDCF